MSEMTVSVEDWTNLHRMILELLDSEHDCDYTVNYCSMHDSSRPCVNERARAIIEEDFPEWTEW